MGGLNCFDIDHED
jgi:WD40 repeat protein